MFSFFFPGYISVVRWLVTRPGCRCPGSLCFPRPTTRDTFPCWDSETSSCRAFYFVLWWDTTLTNALRSAFENFYQAKYLYTKPYQLLWSETFLFYLKYLLTKYFRRKKWLTPASRCPTAGTEYHTSIAPSLVTSWDYSQQQFPVR